MPDTDKIFGANCVVWATRANNGVLLAAVQEFFTNDRRITAPKFTHTRGLRPSHDYSLFECIVPVRFGSQTKRTGMQYQAAGIERTSAVK